MDPPATLAADFPVWGLLPKKETGALAMLQKYPNFDGRGVVIAVLDSGVDPGAPGLQVTTDGKPKVIDRIDCSGAGDVDTSTVVEKDSKGFITGVSGRKLKIPESWTCPTAKYHVGIKDVSSVFDHTLTERVLKERKKKHWAEAQSAAIAEAVKARSDFERARKPDELVDLENKLWNEELATRIETLEAAEKIYPPFLVPALDCVVFHDGETWKACIDTTPEGNLGMCKLMGNYREAFEFSALTDSDAFNYSFNIHNDGNLLEIVGMCSSHGTHVAAIAAANFPDEPEKNGVAPGAQIISLNIGDARIRTMETGTSVARAIIRVIESRLPGYTGTRIDLINMSYGEKAHFNHSGRLAELMDDAVNKHGVIWLCCAGNDGPALSTIWAPTDSKHDSIIGVGAYVFPEMTVAGYSLREKVAAMPYTWSSRGPLKSGGRGVSIAAPGGAVTSVPNYTLSPNALMNGTSMASPNACGCFALLLSGLKAKGVPFSPYSVRRSVEVTAMELSCDTALAHGHGLIQVDKAFDHLVSWSHEPETSIRFEISVGGREECHGIFLPGNFGKSGVIQDRTVGVKPAFLDDENAPAEGKINFNAQLKLVSRASWVRHSSHVGITFGSKTFQVRVDPTGLKPGLHFASVQAYDPTKPEKGWLFDVPVTVVKPEVLTEASVWKRGWDGVTFGPGAVERHFLGIPDHATFCRFGVRNLGGEKSAKFVLHAVHMRPDERFTDREFQKYFDVTADGNEMEFFFQVIGGLTMEVVLARWWANLGDVTVDYNVQFGSIKPCLSPTSGPLTIHGADQVTRIDVRAPLGVQEILPTVSLDHCVVVLRPDDFKLETLGSRDVVHPGRRIFAANLTYKLQLKRDAEVTPRCPLLSDHLYENEFESQLWMLYDSNKRCVAVGDAYPSNYSTKLEKGDYVLKMQVRHEKRELLEKVIADMVTTAWVKCEEPVSLAVYPTWTEAVVVGKKCSATLVSKDSMTSVYIPPFLPEKTAKLVSPGNFLMGKITFAKDPRLKDLTSYPFRFIVADQPKEAGKGKNEEARDANGAKEELAGELNPKDEKAAEAFECQLREFKISKIAKTENGAVRRKLYEEVVGAGGDSGVPDVWNFGSSPVAAHHAFLVGLCSDVKLWEEKVEKSPDQLSEVVHQCDVLINDVDEQKLLVWFGSKNIGLTPDFEKTKAFMEKQRSSLLDAYCAKGVALSLADATTNLPQITSVLVGALRFAEFDDPKVVKLTVRHAVASGHYARALKLLWKLEKGEISGVENVPSPRELELEAVRLMECLGWRHVADVAKMAVPRRFPRDYLPF